MTSDDLARMSPSARAEWIANLRSRMLEASPAHVDLARAAWTLLVDMMGADPLPEPAGAARRERVRNAMLAALDEGASVVRAAREAAGAGFLGFPTDREFSRWIRPEPGVFLIHSTQFRHNVRA